MTRLDRHAHDFEAYALGQISPGPWVPVTDYSLDARRIAEGTHPALIREVFAPQRVLDFGCGPGRLVSLLRELGVAADGYEPQAAQRAAAEAEVQPFLSPVFPATPVHDVVICREVLEHVPLAGGAFLDTVRRIVRCSTRFVYVTTRFARQTRHLLDHDLADNLDPTHITLLTKPFVRTLFVLQGCKSRPRSRGPS